MARIAQKTNTMLAKKLVHDRNKLLINVSMKESIKMIDDSL